MNVTGLMLVDSGEKVNGQYYSDVLLSQQMLPAIKYVHLPAGQCAGPSYP